MSSYYSAIDRRINADEWFRGLDIERQWLWFRLLTGSHVTQVAGLWPVTEDGLARSFKISTRKFLTLFEAFDGRAFADWGAGVIYLPNALKIEPNQPRNEAHLKGWIKPLELVPECRLRDRALDEFIAWIKSEPKRFPNGVPAGFPRPKAPPSVPFAPAPPTPAGTDGDAAANETVSVIVTETVTGTVTETVEDTVSPTVTETMPSRARAQPHPGPKTDHETEHDHETEPTTTVGSSGPDRIRCPVPIPVPGDTLAQLSMSIGMPTGVAVKSILDFSLAWNAKTSDLRFPEAWVGSVVKAMVGDWSDPAKRERMKAAVRDSTQADPMTLRRRREAAEAAHAKRHESEVRELAAKVGARVIPPGEAAAAVAKLVEGR